MAKRMVLRRGDGGLCNGHNKLPVAGRLWYHRAMLSASSQLDDTVQSLSKSRFT